MGMLLGKLRYSARINEQRDVYRVDGSVKSSKVADWNAWRGFFQGRDNDHVALGVALCRAGPLAAG